MKALYGDKLAFWGGSSTQRCLPYATPDEVQAETSPATDKPHGKIPAQETSVLDWKTFEAAMLPDEYWWSGCIDDAQQMPLDAGSVYHRSLEPNASYNQAAPLLLSSRGRYIWCEDGFDIDVAGGLIALRYKTC